MSASSTSVMNKSQGQSTHSQPESNIKQHSWKKPWRYLGFNKTYNGPLFIILAGAMFGFCLAKLPTLNITTWSRQAAPGERYWFSQTYYRTGIHIHLASTIPLGILLPLQFVPTIRHHLVIHRINGYIILLFILIANISGMLIVRRAFGGDLSTQAAVGILAIATTSSAGLAYYNVKKLQIEQHRAWMLRTAVYLGTIITTRLIVIITAQTVTMVGSYWVVMNCGEILSMRDEEYAVKYGCQGVTSSKLDQTNVAVKAAFGSELEEIAASLRVGFGMALWISIFLHGVGVEIYLALTPREAQRLRLVSYEKQLKAGYPNPGSAGLVVEKFGDAEAWQKL